MDEAQRLPDLWRRPLASWSPGERADLMATLAKLELPREPRWRMARAGDAASAVAVALDRWGARAATDARFDMAMNALALCSGNPGARLVLRHIQGRERSNAGGRVRERRGGRRV